MWTHCAYEPTAADVAWTMGWGDATMARGGLSQGFCHLTTHAYRNIHLPPPRTKPPLYCIIRATDTLPYQHFFFIPPNKALYLSLHFVVHFYIPMIVHMKYPSFVASSHEVKVQIPLNVTLGETYWGVWSYARSWSLLFWDVMHRILAVYYRRFGTTYRSYLLKVGPTRCP